MVDVRAQRRLSLGIAERSGVRHESPQVIVFRQGVPIWDASHGDVTANEIERQLPRA
jgi:bacillithiol system protein YtxJ